jgi:hypothetical protein
MNKFLLFLLLGLLAGCTPSIKALPLADAERFSIQAVARLGATGPMAVSADGRMVAWGDDGLQLRDLDAEHHKKILDARPETLCWSPDGTQLAATIRLGDVSQLNVFDRNGNGIYVSELDGRVARLQWPRTGGLTAGVMAHKNYKFGTSITQQLYRWDEGWRRTETPLYETTLMPSTVAQLTGGRIYETFDFDLSPLTDEVLYTRLHAPPAFTASRHLILYNLRTGQEREISALPLLSGRGRLTADGESALIAAGRGKIRRQDLWSGKILSDWSGDYLDYAAASELLVANERLYAGSELLLELPAGSRAQLSSSGRFLLVKWHKQLYLLSSYAVAKSPSIEGGKLEKLLKLRRLRSRGLIEQNEYLQARERLLQ